MSMLRTFMSDLLETADAVVDPVGDECLDVLAPEPVRTAFGWHSELVRLGFGPTRSTGAIPVGLEGDWLNRVGTLLGERGQTGMRQLARPDAPAPSAPERLIEKALELPNAVWRLAGRRETWTRCLLLAFRYTATSDEKRDGVTWLGFNLGTGAILDPLLLARLGGHLADHTSWLTPEPEALEVAETGYADTASLTGRIPALLEHRVRAELDTFLHSMRRRLDRDRKRVHAYHDDLRQTAQAKLGKIRAVAPEKAEADHRRETLRIEAIEREYAAKIEDLKHKYALQIQAEWVQGLVLLVPVERFEILIKRRKGERIIAMDWHAPVRQMETPLDETGLGVDHVRLVCDELLHLTDATGQSCPACAKDRCRACHPAACPRCKL